MKILNNLTQDKLNELIGINNLHKMYLDKYDEFITYLTNAPEDFMSHEELDFVCELMDIESDVVELLHGALDKINASYEAKVTCYYFKYITYIAYYSTANTIYQATHATSIEDYILHSFALLCPIKWRYEEAINRGIPKDMITSQFGDIRRHVHCWMRNKESDGVIRWDTICAYLEIFPTTMLAIEPFINTVSWHGFKNKDGQVLILMSEGRTIRKDGQIDGVNGVFDPDFKTIYEENDNYFIGNPVNPYGVVDKKVVKLNKKDWEVFPKKDDWFIEFHVSSHKGYTLEGFKTSLQEAIDFFKNYYPERNFVCVRGFSWLFSPQLKYFLDENKGNISRIKKIGYTVPVATGESNVFNFIFHNTDIKPEEIPETTSLYKGIKKYLLDGGRINCGEMMFFLKDLDHIEDNVYLSSYEEIISSLEK